MTKNDGENEQTPAGSTVRKVGVLVRVRHGIQNDSGTVNWIQPLLQLCGSTNFWGSQNALIFCFSWSEPKRKAGKGATKAQLYMNLPAFSFLKKWQWYPGWLLLDGINEDVFF